MASSNSGAFFLVFIIIWGYLWFIDFYRRWMLINAVTITYDRFYFRFLFSHQDLIELGNYDMLKQFILRDYETFTGKTLERYFTAKLQEEGNITKIGSWWDKKSENEIDIITINELKKTCRITESSTLLYI